MKKIIIILKLFFFILYGKAQIVTRDSSNITPYRFAVRLVADGHGNQQFFIIKVNSNNKIVGGEQIQAMSFLRQAYGKEKSKANPWKKNFFKEYHIKDSSIIFSLWKLRYAQNPWKTDDSTNMFGWTMRKKYPFIPYNSQLKILGRYGLNNINGFIYGKKLFHLLKDMEDPNWIKTYQDAADPKEDDLLDKQRNYYRNQSDTTDN